MKITENQVEIVARHLHGLGWSSGGDYVEDFKPDVRAALSHMVSMPKSASQVSDNELSGMWSNSDFEGGDTDERSYALRNAPTAEPVAQGEAVAWMTHHDTPMLFLSREEAAAYCDDNEAPIPLYLAPPIALAAVRDVIAELRGWDKRYHGLHGLAGKLEAAIKGVA